MILSSADLFKINFYKKILSGTISGYQTDWIQIRTDIMSVLIWVHTVCKGYKQMTKVAASKDRVIMVHQMDEKCCGSWSAGITRSQLIWVYFVFKLEQVNSLSPSVVC